MALVADPGSVRERLHPRCIACSPTHPDGLKLVFRAECDGSVTTELYCSEDLEGYSRTLHGGVISLVFDSAMVNYLFAHGLRALTAELLVHFVKPVALGRVASVTACVVHHQHPLYVLEGRMLQDGEPKARASAKFIAPRQVHPEPRRSTQ